MPGMTVYLDTPMLPVSAFAAGYNPPDCALPAATPAIKRVDGDGIGPWVAVADGTHTLTITALGDVLVQNPNYQGPIATTAPFNTRTITRHYGFGAAPGTGRGQRHAADGDRLERHDHHRDGAGRRHYGRVDDRRLQ